MDDLVQEGMINVWERLRRDTFPLPEFIKLRMLDWIRFLHRLERGDSTSYESVMESSAH